MHAKKSKLSYREVDEKRKDESFGPAWEPGPYVDRVNRLLADLESTGDSPEDGRRALGRLANLLEELVDDLESVDAPAAAVHPLRDLLDKVRAALAAATDPAPTVTEAIGALRAFARSAPKGGNPAEAGRDGFWK